MRRLPLLLPVLLLLAGCSQGVPSGKVAVVKDAPQGQISQQEFDRWLKIAGAKPSGSMPSGVPDYPRFTGCVAQVRPADISAAQKKTRCEKRYRQLRRQTMQFLISSRWISGQAAQEGISVSPSAVERELERQLRSSFPGGKGQKEFLDRSGLSRQELLFRTRLNLLSSRLRAEAISTPTRPTESQIAEFYKTNSRRFGQPESREVQIISAKSPAQAQLVRSLLDRGQGFAKVARRYSSDSASAARGGEVTISAGGLVGPELEKAVFGSAPDRLVGPVRSGYVYYVFRVTKINPSTKQSLSEARPVIVDLLGAQLRRQQVSDYLKELERKWRSRTSCAEGYVIPACSNG